MAFFGSHFGLRFGNHFGGVVGSGAPAPTTTYLYAVHLAGVEPETSKSKASPAEHLAEAIPSRLE